MAFVPIHQANGLYNHSNELIAPEGAYAVADNVLINRDNVAECRPGFSNCSGNFPAGLPRQLYSTQSAVLCHVNNELWYHTGDCNWMRIGGGALIEGFVGLYRGTQALWGDRNYLYFANATQIRRMRLSDLYVDVLAGDPSIAGNVDATGTAARFTGINGIAGDTAYLYVTCSNHVVRRVNRVTGAVTTFAGSPGANGNVNGIGAAARFDVPASIAVNGTTAYIVDQNSTVLRTMDTATANVGGAVVSPTGVISAKVQSFGNYLFLQHDTGSGSAVIRIYTVSPFTLVAQTSNAAYWFATDGTSIFSNVSASNSKVGSFNLSGALTGSDLFGGYSVGSDILSGAYLCAYYAAGIIYVFYATHIDALQVSTGKFWTVAGTKGVPGTTNGYGTLPIIEP